MSQTDHTCLKTKYLGDVQGEPRLIFQATCRDSECQFKEEALSESSRDEAVRRHQRVEAKKTIYRGLSNAVKDDPKMLAEALARFADIATHEYDEWFEVVGKLMKEQFDRDMEGVDIGPLRHYYDSGTDALTAAGNLVNRIRVPLAYR